MKIMNRILMLAMLFILSLALTACGSDNPKDSGSDSIGKMEEQAESNHQEAKKDDEEKKPQSYPAAEIMFYSTNGDTEEVFDAKYGNPIRKKFPQHTIKFTQHKSGSRYPDVLAAGMPIDIIFESIANFSTGPIAYATAMDMEPLIKKHNTDLSRLEQSSIEAMRTMSDGKLLGLPTYTNSLALYYNKDIFSKFGLEFPKDGMTWDDAFDLNRLLTRKEGDLQYVGISFNTNHFFRMNPFSAPNINAALNMAISDSTEQWRKIYDILAIRPAEATGYADYVREKGIAGNKQFITEQNLAMLGALTNIPITQDMSQMDWDVVALPTHKDHPGVGPQMYPSYFGVSSLSKYPDQSMEIINYLLSDEFQIEWSRTGNMPAVHSKKMIDVFAEDTYFKDKNVRNAFFVNYAAAPMKTIYDGEAEKIYNKYVAQLIVGEIDFNTAVRSIEEEGNKKLAELKDAK